MTSGLIWLPAPIFTLASMIALDELYRLFKKHPEVCTDTRRLSHSCLFFALKGDNFDGNTFAEKALHGGAAYAVVDNPQYATDPRCLLVDDVLKTLQDLARLHRQHFDIPVIGIAGSNGKTTTKELVSAVLASHYPCHFTRGNLNNHIGVPLTLLAMPDNTEVAVIELGTNHPGELAELCEIALPTHGLITNIGKEHLEGFGSLEGVKKAEGELYQFLSRRDGCVFVNLEEKYLKTMARRIRKKVTYARTESFELAKSSNPIPVRLIGETPFLQLAFLSQHNEPIQVDTRIVGRYNFNNLMTTIALGIYFKVPDMAIKYALEAYEPANNRSQLIRRDSNTFLLDAYNANPSSMKAALESFRDTPARHKVAILGDMLELGPGGPEEHAAMLRFALRCKLDTIVLVGPVFGQCTSKASHLHYFPDAQSAKAWFRQQSFQDTSFLLKGSRGIRLEQVIEP